MRPYPIPALLPFLLVLAGGHQPARGGVSRLWGEAGERWERGGRLPDFSRAGYRNGQDPPELPVVANLLDFGGKGDGVTDNSPAFEKALAAVKGGALLIPAGTWLLRKRLHIRADNMVIRGEGADRTTVFIDRSLGDLYGGIYSLTDGFFQAEGRKEVGFEDFTIRFNNVAYAGHHNEKGRNGIYFKNSSDCWVDGVTVIDCDSGFLMGEVQRITVTRCAVSGRKGHYCYQNKGGTDLLFHANASLSDHHHSTNVERSHGVVYSDIRGGGFPVYMDNHGMNPYDNLFTNFDATASYISGGAANRMPHAGKGTTFWNQRYKPGEEIPNPSISTWGGAKAPRDYLLIVTDLPSGQQSLTDKNWWEDVGALRPRNLWKSQVARLRGLADRAGTFQPAPLPSRADFEEASAGNWALMPEEDGTANRYFLASTLYAPKSGGRLGEYAVSRSGGHASVYATARSPEMLELQEGADLALVLDFVDEGEYLLGLFSAKAGESGIHRVRGGTRQVLRAVDKLILDDNLWHHYSLHREAGELRLAVDGKVAAAMPDPGRSGPGRIGVGSLDDAAWFARISPAPYPFESAISVRKAAPILRAGPGGLRRFDVLGRDMGRFGPRLEGEKIPLPAYLVPNRVGR